MRYYDCLVSGELVVHHVIVHLQLSNTTIAIYQASIVSDVNVHCIVAIGSLCCMCHGDLLSHPLPYANGGTL